MQTRRLRVYIVITETLPVSPWMAAHLYGAETKYGLSLALIPSVGALCGPDVRFGIKGT